MSLYPLKFQPILKEIIWGGDRLVKNLGKDGNPDAKIGESWEISGVEGDISVVTNGELSGETLTAIIDKEKDQLLGKSVYNKFGNQFPLLIKFIDANADLSIQVHPNDTVAKERHNSFGKTEMWYAMEDNKDGHLISGFSKETSKEEFISKLNDGTLEDLFNYQTVNKGDSFFIPAGRLHAICSGCLICEIQQTSNITYRLYDYNRKDDSGNTRELHVDEGVGVIDYSATNGPKSQPLLKENTPVSLATCNYFTTNLLKVTEEISRDYNTLDSFVVLICTEGEGEIRSSKFDTITVTKGETVLIPAAIKDIKIKPNGSADIIETYIEQ